MIRPKNGGDMFLRNVGIFPITWHYNTNIVLFIATSMKTSSSTYMRLSQCGLLVLKLIQQLCYRTSFRRPSEKASLSSGGPQFPFSETLEYIMSQRTGNRFPKEDKIFSSLSYPDRLWGPANLYQMGTGNSNLGANWQENKTCHLNLVPRLRILRAILALHFTSSRYGAWLITWINNCVIRSYL
jgi:hypothetical protein